MRVQNIQYQAQTVTGQHLSEVRYLVYHKTAGSFATQTISTPLSHLNFDGAKGNEPFQSQAHMQILPTIQEEND